MDATKALSVSVIQILAASAMAVILWVVSMPSMIDSISSGDFVVLISSMMMLLRPLKQLANVNSDLQRGISAAQSVFLSTRVIIELMQRNTVARWFRWPIRLKRKACGVAKMGAHFDALTR